jgi:hypothetical protein
MYRRSRAFSHSRAHVSIAIAACGGTPVSPTSPPPPANIPLASIELDTLNVAAGQTARGTVTLSVAAPANGVVVTLTSSDPARVTVPATVTVPGGQMTATFTVTTAAGAQEAAVTISAATTGEAKTVNMTVVLPGALARLELDFTSVTGGQHPRGTITLTSPAGDGGVVVALSSSNDLATVPASVTIGAGQSSASFTVTTRLTGRDGEVTITATVAGSTRTARLSILEARLTEFDINPRAINGALPARGTAVFSGPHSNPTLRMTSSDTTVVSSANIQLLPQSNTFSIPTRSTMRERTVTLTLECCGGSFTNTLRVLPMLLQFQVPPQSPLSGESTVVDLTTRASHTTAV